MILVLSSNTFLSHNTGNHPENSERLKRVLEYLPEGKIANLLFRDSFREATDEEIQRVHSQSYLQHLKEFCESGGGRIETDTVVSNHSYAVVRSAAGCSIEAVDQVISGKVKHAFCAIRPPGHHALSDQAMGFCLLNHVAIAARHALVHHHLQRILIVDWDVHHGNGTQDIFYEVEGVHYFSIHRAPFYPGTGSAEETGASKGLGATWNLPLAFGVSRSDYLSQFERLLTAAASKCRPELILISSGFDAHKEDPIGSLGLETDDFGELTRLVLNVADEYCDGKVVSLLEGGYNPDKLAESVISHLDVLGEV